MNKQIKVDETIRNPQSEQERMDLVVSLQALSQYEK